MVFKTKEAVQNYGLPGQISRPPSTQFVSIQLEVRGSGLSGRAFSLVLEAWRVSTPSYREAGTLALLP